MARIPVGRDLGRRPVLSPVAAVQTDASTFGAGLAQDVGGFIDRYRERVVKRENLEAEAKFTEFVAKREADLDAASREIVPGGAGFVERTSVAYKSAGDEFLGAIPERLKTVYQHRLAATGSEYQRKAFAFEQRESDRYQVETLDSTLKTLESQISATPGSAAGLVLNGVRTIEMADLPVAVKAERKRAFRQQAKALELSATVRQDAGYRERIISRDPELVASMSPEVFEVARNAALSADRDAEAAKKEASAEEKARLTEILVQEGRIDPDVVRNNTVLTSADKLSFLDRDRADKDRVEAEVERQEAKAEREREDAFRDFSATLQLHIAEGGTIPSGAYDKLPSRYALPVAKAVETARRARRSEAKAAQTALSKARKDWYYEEMAGGRTFDPEVIAGDKSLDADDKIALQRMSNTFRDRESSEVRDELGLRSLMGEDVSVEQIIASDMNNGDKRALVSAVLTTTKDKREADAALNDIVQGVKLNPYVSDDRKTVDSIYASRFKNVDPLTDPKAQSFLAGVALQSGVVGNNAVASIRAAAASGDPERVIAAMNFASMLDKAAPGALRAATGGSEVVALLDEYRSEADAGYGDAQIAETMIDRRTLEARRAKDILGPEIKDYIDGSPALDDIFDDTMWDLSNPFAGATPEQRIDMQALWRSTLESEYLKSGGRPEIARARAKTAMRQRYGVSTVTGAKLATEFPPESYYGPVDGSHDWMREQFEQDIQKRFGDVDMNQVRLVATEQSAGRVAAGMAPQYRIVVFDDDGEVKHVTSSDELYEFDMEAVLDEAAGKASRVRDDAVRVLRENPVTTGETIRLPEFGE